MYINIKAQFYIELGIKAQVFFRNNGQIMENMDKGLTVPKWVLIVWQKILQMPHNFSAHAPKLYITMKKGFIGRQQSVLILNGQDIFQFQPNRFLTVTTCCFCCDSMTDIEKQQHSDSLTLKGIRLLGFSFLSLELKK